MKGEDRGSGQGGNGTLDEDGKSMLPKPNEIRDEVRDKISKKNNYNEAANILRSVKKYSSVRAYYSMRVHKEIQSCACNTRTKQIRLSRWRTGMISPNDRVLIDFLYR